MQHHHHSNVNGINANAFNHAQMHPQSTMAVNNHHLLGQQHQQTGHMLKPPQAMNNGMEVSPGPPSTLNPNAVGNTNSSHVQNNQHQINSHSSVSPPGTAGVANNGFFPFMLPYPYSGYGLPTAEQQAGLAELLLQQQRLNAAAAQLIGMPPPQLGQQQQQQQSQQPLANNNNSQFAHNPATTAGPGGIPPYSLLFPGLLGGFQNGAQQQLYQNYQQQYGQFNNAVPQQPQPTMQQQQHAPPQQQSKGSQGLYPDLDDLMKNENMPPAPMQNGHYTSSGSRGNDGNYRYNSNGHTRSDSSNGASPVSSHNYHSVSPQPPAYMPSRHHPDYNHHHQQQQQQQQQYAYSNNGVNGAHLFQKHGNHNQHHNNNGGNTVVGKGKRSFESEADTLLNDLKKKRYDGSNGSQCEYSAYKLFLCGVYI